MKKNKPYIRVGRAASTTGFLDLLVFSIAWIITLASIVAGFVPLLLTFFLILFVISVVVQQELQTKSSLTISVFSDSICVSKSPMVGMLFAFCIYIAISSFWSADIMTSFLKAGLVAMVVIACCLGHLLAATTSKLQLHRFARGILIGTLIALAFPLVEQLTDQTILNFLADRFPGLIKTAGTKKTVPEYYLNKSVTALALTFWPALLLSNLWPRQRSRLLFTALLVGSILPTVFLSQSETAKAAIILGSLGFVGAHISRRHLHIAAQGLWVTAVIGAVPLVMALHWVGLQKNTGLPYSARDRIHIWNYTAKKVPQNPLLGIGVRSSRFYNQRLEPALPITAPPKLKDRAGWHSHNMFLQTWYELGAVGASFLLAIGLLLLNSIKSIDTRLQPFAYAAFASFCTISAFGYGMWQSWLLACFGWTVLFFIFAFRYTDENDAS